MHPTHVTSRLALALSVVALATSARVHGEERERAGLPEAAAEAVAAAPAASGAPSSGTRADPNDPDSGAEMIGRPAPEWRFARWIGTRPLEVEDLRGKVVLMRWWTEECHFCRTTLPVLEGLRREHADEGLVVVGVFHPKPPRPVSDRHIRKLARELRFGGLLAVDPRWEALDRYWLTARPERNWTSVSFLIDRSGAVRWVHGGGEYHPTQDPEHARCDTQYRELERVLDEVLAEKAP